MSNRWATAIILLLLVALTSWIQSALEEGLSTPAKQARGKPDAIMKDFSRTDMDEDGRPKAKLKADLMKHFPHDDSTELEAPVLEIYNKDSNPWHVTAERGWINGKGEVILLYGKVYIWRNSDQGGHEIEVITTDLKVLLKEEYAETDNFAMIIGQSTNVTTVGLRANFKKKHLELLNKVRGRHEFTPKS